MNVAGETQARTHAVQRSSGGTQPQPLPDMTRATEIPGDRYGRWLAGCGVVGPILLILYFGLPALVPRLGSLLYSGGTPATAKIVTVGADYHLLLSVGCWMQGTGAVLCVVFLLALAAVLATGRPVLPSVFTRLAAVIGIGFLIIGFAVAVTPTAAAVAGGLAALQGLWILAAGITALLSPGSLVPPAIVA